MAERIQKSKSAAKREAVVAEAAAATAEQRDTSDIDDLLDEIDAVLEENAEEFVKSYIQKGGE